MSFDYTGSFSGSFSGDITATNGVISSSAQVNYAQVKNKPTTISAFQKNSIVANNNFRENTYPTDSASFDSRITNLVASSSDSQILSFNQVSKILTISNGNSVDLSSLGGGVAGGSSIWSTGSDYYYVNSDLQVTGSFKVSGGITASLDWSNIDNVPSGLISGASQITDVVDSTYISASVVASGFGGTSISISGSSLDGQQLNGTFTTLQFDSDTGLHVTSSDGLTALVSIGSHFRDIFVSGSETLIATGSDQMEIVAGDGMLIDTSLVDTNMDGVSKELRFRIDTSSQHFIDAVNAIAGEGGIFTQTGSVYSTTNDLEITGSLTINNGVFKLEESSTLPPAEGGAIIYSASTFYFGID
jgi:hypothetical protein